jgi:hypothetical protein
LQYQAGLWGDLICIMHERQAASGYPVFTDRTNIVSLSPEL